LRMGEPDFGPCRESKGHAKQPVSAGFIQALAVERMQILAISGSLRGGSSNTALLLAAAALAPTGLNVMLYENLAGLPHFNPDLDQEPFPAAVTDFRAQLRKSAGVIISCPEYAHGVPGVLKNALDWLVASGELFEKPVALFNASPRGTYALASLTETLTVMTARLVPEASVSLVFAPKGHGQFTITGDPEQAARIQNALAAFAKAIGAAASAAKP